MSKKFYIVGSSASFQNLYSVDLDGVNEYITVPDNSVFSFGNGAGTDSPFSVSIWFKRTNAAGNDMLIAKIGSLVFEWYFFLVAGVARFGLWNPGATAAIMRTAPMSTTGSWVHLVGTYSGNKATSGIKIYANGTQIDNANITIGAYNGMTNTASIVSIGAENTGGSPFIGKLAHPAIFSKELSGAEVTELYNKKMGDLRTLSFGANLIEAWRFPNGTSDYPTYEGYNASHNGTMQNAESTDINTDVP